jgi:hypothetical protein
VPQPLPFLLQANLLTYLGCHAVDRFESLSNFEFPGFAAPEVRSLARGFLGKLAPSPVSFFHLPPQPKRRLSSDAVQKLPLVLRYEKTQLLPLPMDSKELPNPTLQASEGYGGVVQEGAASPLSTELPAHHELLLAIETLRAKQLPQPIGNGKQPRDP